MFGVMKKFLLILFLALSATAVHAHETEKHEKPLSGYEGPYVMYTDEGVRVVAMTDGVVSDTTYTSLPGDFRLKVYSNHDGSHFYVQLREPIAHEWKQKRKCSRRTLVMSDLHGRMDAFVALLKGNGVVDGALNWKYGHNRLVFIGDALDRGRDDTAIVWLLYKLEAEAAKAGGEVVFLYGNHEDLVTKNDLRYVNKSHLRFADTIGIPYAELWGNESETGHWIRDSHLVFLLGNNLFVHAGLSHALMEEGYTFEEMNFLAKEYLGYATKQRSAMHPRNKFFFGNSGPLWYRGMAYDDEKYNPISEEQFAEVMAHYGVDRVFIGHSEVDEVESRYDGRVIAVNVKHGDNFPANRSGAVLLKGKKLYVVDYEGNRTRIGK